MGCKRVKMPKRMRKTKIKTTAAKVLAHMGGPDAVSPGYVHNLMAGRIVGNTELGRRVRAAVAELSKCTVQDIWPGMDVE